MQSRTRVLAVAGFAGFLGLGPGTSVGEAQQQVTIESVFPGQLPRGQATLVNVAVPGRDLMVQGAEIAPAAGVTVSGIKRAVESQGIGWWEFTVDVAADAAPGTRTLVLVLPAGRTLPVNVSIPAHIPRIADLKVVSARPGQPAVDVEFAATDPSNDLGTLPYVWFTIGCGGGAEPIVGAVRGTVSAGRVRAQMPNPRATAGAPQGGPCELRLRATDSAGIESNTLSTPFELRN